MARLLLERGFDVVFGGDVLRGKDDEEVLACTRGQGRVVVTDDKDFGELVFRHRKRHAGVIFLRTTALGAESKVRLIVRALRSIRGALAKRAFVVVAPRRLRVIRPGGTNP